MGVNHGGRKNRGDESPRIWSGKKLMQFVYPQILSCFKISNTRSLAMQCSKTFTNLITLTAHSLLPKSTSSTSTKSPLRAEYRSKFTQIRHFKCKKLLWKRPSSLPKLLLGGEGYLIPTPTSRSPPPIKVYGSALRPPEFQPDLLRWAKARPRDYVNLRLFSQPGFTAISRPQKTNVSFVNVLSTPGKMGGCDSSWEGLNADVSVKLAK